MITGLIGTCSSMAKAGAPSWATSDCYEFAVATPSQRARRRSLHRTSSDLLCAAGEQWCPSDRDLAGQCVDPQNDVSAWCVTALSLWFWPS